MDKRACIKLNLNPRDVAARMLVLAVNASDVGGGMAVFAAMATPFSRFEDVDACDFIQNGIIYADYVHGRMVKLHVAFDERCVFFPEQKPTAAYQSWCSTYPKYVNLYQTAVDQLVAERG